MNPYVDLVKRLVVDQPLAPFSIDTRTLKPGDLFVALDGVNQKGQTFLAEAFQRGATAALCAVKYQAKIQMDLQPPELNKVYFVEDPVLAMAALARAHRDQFSLPLIAVAGSVGKTSTTQFLAYLLSRHKKVLATVGNLNNQLGLPMMLSRLERGHDLAVLEMGADHGGDLANLIHIAEPTLAVLTPIAPEHLQGFGSLKGVYDGELEILQSKRLQTLITVQGDAELDRRLKGWNGKVIRVGLSQTADVIVSEVRVEDGKIRLQIQGQNVVLPTAASFLALNAGLAAAMAVETGLSWSDVAGEWTTEMPKGRFSNRKIANDITVIDDTYNSSPQAFSAALEALKKMKFKRKWVIFSDMLELGVESAGWHEALADDLARSDVYAAWSFGSESRRTFDKLKMLNAPLSNCWFQNSEILADELVRQVESGDVLLFKGSRGMRVERVIEVLESVISKTASI